MPKQKPTKTDQAKKAEADAPVMAVPQASDTDFQDVKEHRQWVKKYFPHWKVLLPLIIAVVLGGALMIVMLSPAKYTVYDAFGDAEAEVLVYDIIADEPISGAVVNIAGRQATTGGDGLVRFLDLPFGSADVTITADGFAEQKFFTTLELGTNRLDPVGLIAMGESYELGVIDTVSKQPINDAKITYESRRAGTNDDGTASLVLPHGLPAEITLKVSADGYLEKEFEVKSNTLDDGLSFELLPNQQVFYLSKKTGKLNVYKSYFDGSGEEVVLEGTGSEGDTTFLSINAAQTKAVLIANRNDETNPNGTAKESLYLLDLKSGDAEKADEGNYVSFYGIEWFGGDFMYSVVLNDPDLPNDSNERAKLKLVNAVSGSLETVLTSRSVNYAGSTLPNGAIVSLYPADGNTQLFYVDRSGDIEEFLNVKAEELGYHSGSVKLVGTDQVEFTVYSKSSFGSPSKPIYYAYNIETNERTELAQESNAVGRSYHVSADDQRLAWLERRDGRGVLQVSDKGGGGTSEVATLDEAGQFERWLGNNYVVLRKQDESKIMIVHVGTGNFIEATSVHSYYGSRSYGY